MKDPEQVFGHKEFQISMEEVLQLERSVRIYTSMPPKFFLHLVGIVSRDENVEYYNYRRAVPLKVLAERKVH